MTVAPDDPAFTIGVIGAGVMGRGIAQIAAEAGLTVRLADARRETVEEAFAVASAMIRRKARKGLLAPRDADAAIARIMTTDAGPQAGYGALADCHLIVEAIAERMDLKHRLLEQVEASVAPECIIATNTSSLSVTAFAAKSRYPERVAGLHFFNPAPLMRLVEVVDGLLTCEATINTLIAVARRLGRHPVRATDTPGFLVNHASRGFGPEGLRIAQEGVADFAAIDRILTESAGFRMGPFELYDLAGLDVSRPVLESIYHQYYEEPRYRPSPIIARLHDAGFLGRKTGRGFYHYAKGKIVRPDEPPAPQKELGGKTAWISGRYRDAAASLRQALHVSGLEIESGTRPSAGAVVFVTPFGEDATAAALAENLDAERTVAVDCLFSLDGRRTLMTTPVTTPEVRDVAHAALACGGARTTVIRDSPGFIAQRVVAMIVNIGCDIAQQRIAAPTDIDTSAELGLGYPRGPLSWGDQIGPRRILDILENLHRLGREPRYRPSLWLRRRAMLGASLCRPDS